VEAAAGGGQLALKEVLVHGEPYEYAYEGTREQYARLFDKTGNNIPYVLHIDTRGVYAHGMHYHGQTDDGSWHEPVAELSGTGNEGTLIDPTDDDARTISSSDFGDEPIPEADEAKPRHLLADHYPSACAPSACAPSACALMWLPAADAVIRGVCRRSPSSSLSPPTPRSGRSHCRRSTRTALLISFLLSFLLSFCLLSFCLLSFLLALVRADRSVCARSVCSRSY